MPVGGIPFEPGCTRCPRLARYRSDIAHGPRPFRGGFDAASYHGAPVAPFGPDGAPLLIVGLAPGFHGANRTGIPFWRDASGDLLYSLLERLGHARLPSREDWERPGSRPALDGVRITNTVKCAPPGNRPLPAEIRTCSGLFLRRELLDPRVRAILAMGGIAFAAIFASLGLRPPPFSHRAQAELDRGACPAWGGPGSGRIPVLATYHFSRQNVNTRRLTPAMAESVLEAAVSLAGAANRATGPTFRSDPPPSRAQ